jgi:MSHA pilin protein MshC
MKKQNGFTLIELILVIILLSIVSLVVVSRFSSSKTFQQRAVFDQIQFLLKLGQKTAITQRRVIYVSSGTQEFRLCYTISSPCLDSQSVSSQGTVITAKTQNIIVSMPINLTFNTQGVAGNTLITIPIGSKNLFIEGVTGYVHD